MLKEKEIVGEKNVGVQACEEVCLGLGLKFNPKALGWGTCGLGAEHRAPKKLGRGVSYWEPNNRRLLKTSFFQKNQAATKTSNKKEKVESLLFYQTEIFPYISCLQKSSISASSPSITSVILPCTSPREVPEFNTTSAAAMAG